MHPNSAKTECPHGHPYTPENTIFRADGRRECRACYNARKRRSYRRERAAAGIPPRPRRGIPIRVPLCPDGHPITSAWSRDCPKCAALRALVAQGKGS